VFLSDSYQAARRAPATARSASVAPLSGGAECLRGARGRQRRSQFPMRQVQSQG
jgi:hypothetical protein